jgi:S-adenosylmethionine hydrolase
MPPIVALLTDFGTRDHYVAAMKGVVLDICADVTLVDITHAIAPQDVAGAAEELAACYRFFPQGTIFLVVVDPGVGSARRPLAAAADGYYFVGPDNGVFEFAVGGAGRTDDAPEAVVLTNSAYSLPTISRTFEGRDRFAPAAAWLAKGVPLVSLGPSAGALTPLPRRVVHVEHDRIDGEVARVDRFGNLVTTIQHDHLLGWDGSTSVVLVSDRQISGLCRTYSDVPAGELCALLGSSGRLEVAVNGGSAADALRIGRGARVRLIRAVGPT